MIITISGVPGAGKSTVGQRLSEHFKIPFYSVGDLRGKMAKERGLTLHELNALGETEDFTDKEVDAYQTELGKRDEAFVIDGRLSWHFIPESFKIYLDVDPEEGARRIFKDKDNDARDDEPDYASIKEVAQKNVERQESDKKRYLKYYGIDHTEKAHFDLFIDTTTIPAEEVVSQIIQAIEGKEA